MRGMKALAGVLLLAVCFFLSGVSDTQADITADLIVYDADDQMLGIFIGNVDNNTVQVYFPSIGSVLNINISTGETLGSDIYYEGDDCSGTPNVLAVGTYRIIKNGETYYTGDKVRPENRQINSVLRSYNSSCEPFSGTRRVVPAQEIILPVSLPVALPLSIETERKYWK